MFGNSSHEAKILILIRCIISLKRENLKFGQMLLSLMLPLKLHLLRRRVCLCSGYLVVSQVRAFEKVTQRKALKDATA